MFLEKPNCSQVGQWAAETRECNTVHMRPAPLSHHLSSLHQIQLKLDLGRRWGIGFRLNGIFKNRKRFTETWERSKRQGNLPKISGIRMAELPGRSEGKTASWLVSINHKSLKFFPKSLERWSPDLLPCVLMRYMPPQRFSSFRIYGSVNLVLQCYNPAVSVLPPGCFCVNNEFSLWVFMLAWCQAILNKWEMCLEGGDPVYPITIEEWPRVCSISVLLKLLPSVYSSLKTSCRK